MKHLRTSFLALALTGALVPPAHLLPAAHAQTPATPGTAFTVVLASESVSDAALAAVSAAGGTVVRRHDALGALEVQAHDPAAFLRAIVRSAEVASVGPTLLATAQPMLAGSTAQLSSASPTPTSPTPVNDPAAYMWNIDRVTRNGAAWSVHRGTHDVVACVVDSGIDLNHPDLVANIVPGSRSFVPGEGVEDHQGHGTLVAGIIAANGRIQGVAPGVGIRAYRIFSSQPTPTPTIAQAIRAAADDGCDVINMSFGEMNVRGQVYFVDPATGERISVGHQVADMVLMQRALLYAVNKGSVLIGGAGNDGIDLANRHAVAEWLNGVFQAQGQPFEVQGSAVHVPGSLPGALTVSWYGGGWGTADRLTTNASYGHGVVDLAAPGGDLGPLFPEVLEPGAYKYLVLGPRPTYLPCQGLVKTLGLCGYGFGAGTSMSIPAVSGVAALIISEEYARTGKKPTPAQVAVRLQQSAEDIGQPGYDAQSGRGMVDALRAMTLR
jgi:subtilisin family serine protease